MAGRHRYLVALVVPRPVGLEIDGLRRALGSRDLERISPHITLVPPVNVGADDVGAAVELVRSVGAATPPITVGLGPAASFSGRDDVVFLAVNDANGAIGPLAARLVSPPLRPPRGREERAFTPHVTLATRLSAAQAATARTALGAYRTEVVFRELVLFEQIPEGSHPWEPIGDFPLGDATVAGRGGRELELTISGALDPAARAFLDAVRLDERPTEPFVLVARADGVVVGVVSGERSERRFRISAYVVDPSRRHEGIGSALLRELVATALASDADGIDVVLDDAHSPLGRFLVAHGFAANGTGRAFGGGASVVLSRPLGGVGA